MPFEAFLVSLHDDLTKLLNGRFGFFVADVKRLGFILSFARLLNEMLGLLVLRLGASEGVSAVSLLLFEKCFEFRKRQCAGMREFF